MLPTRLRLGPARAQQLDRLVRLRKLVRGRLPLRAALGLPETALLERDRLLRGKYDVQRRRAEIGNRAALLLRETVGDGERVYAASIAVRLQAERERDNRPILGGRL